MSPKFLESTLFFEVEVYGMRISTLCTLLTLLCISTPHDGLKFKLLILSIYMLYTKVFKKHVTVIKC